MIEYRPFINSDPPAIVEIWRSQVPMRGLAQPMTLSLLDQAVLSKPYFRADGFIVAVEDGRPIGFVHAGFGPTQDFSETSHEKGITCLLQVAPHEQQKKIAHSLLLQSEKFLHTQGANILFAGGTHDFNPFYLGLYGGSDLPGILESDSTAQALFQEAGYKEVERCLIFQRELEGFRPIVDRQQMRIRRTHKIEAIIDPKANNWWEACTWGPHERTQFRLSSRDSQECGRAVYWDIFPLAASWGVHAVGLVELEIATEHRHEGLGTHLVGESLRQLHSHGATICEVQALEHNRAVVGLYQKLGFNVVDQGLTMQKTI